ncbi:MAG: hypothetical protein LQ343_000654 [Gyalolechia ehrenbergii]|nr:MAG: hypothetical protein LQ343_000654 [Gyalolechia ehrenbergii]
MNDPGLNEPIQQESKNVEEDRKDEEDLQKEDEQAFLDPSRWWFASTAFPLLAGTFGPMASAFSVCALVENWRVIVPHGPGGNEAHGINIKDPGWLIVINTISLVLALIANIALLLNMARRLSFSIAQPITIVGWFISSVLLIALVFAATYGMELPGEDRALTQAFYYAIIAAGLYFVIATLMCVTVYGAYKEHYPQEFKLTMSQRTLMLQTISYMVYLLAGSAVYYRVEGWKFLDCVYFTNYTLLTIGIGDYAPQTRTGRALLFPYAVGGIVILGLVVGSIRSLVLERGKKKLGSRMIEKKREQLIKKMHKKGQRKKLTPIDSDEKADELGMTERERRKFEFELMRQIQDQANERQKWNALFISGSAWLVLWLVGGVVFWKAEHAQEWSYFGGLYFAYTSLLTIGYGDYKNFSNSGKPAFVFWSLLAVPTLTIVISNMGDTVVKAIRDATDYLGQFTLLPGEVSAKQRAKQLVTSLTSRFGKDNEAGETMMDQPPGMIGEKEGQDLEGPNRQLRATDRLAGEVESEELQKAGEAKKRGDQVSKDVHEYHYQLVREFRKVMGHLNQTPPRRYTYEEWAWFLKLMGEDEDNQRSHRQAPINIRSDSRKEGGPDMQQGPTHDKEQQRQWSWLGNRSPLMGEVDEPEWVLERLSITLEKELKRRHEEGRRGRREKASNLEGKAPSRSGSSKTLEQQESNGEGGHASVSIP